jgi:UDP-glucose 4-epimerase
VRDVYITGASGVIGSELARHFLHQPDCHLSAVSRRPCALLPETHAAQIIVDTPFDAGWFTPERRHATILHCAGLSDPRQGFAGFDALAQSHILPHVTMIERLLAQGWAGRLVFFSSGGAIYGNPQHLPITEAHPTRPVSLYGLHKLFLEQAFEHLARSRGFELIILRVANPYGTALSKPTQGVIPILLRAFETDSPFQIIGDGTAQRDYLHISDLCRAVSLCLTLPMADPVMVLNIGSGEGVALNDLIALIGDHFQRRLRTQHIPAIHDVQHNVLCRRRAQEVLGWQPHVSLTEGLRREVGRRAVGRREPGRCKLPV